jgi:hypothetical protein
MIHTFEVVGMAMLPAGIVDGAVAEDGAGCAVDAVLGGGGLAEGDVDGTAPPGTHAAARTIATTIVDASRAVPRCLPVGLVSASCRLRTASRRSRG